MRDFFKLTEQEQVLNKGNNLLAIIKTEKVDLNNLFVNNVERVTFYD